jgi:hypothetical protein
VFSPGKKQAQQITHNLLSGHCALIAWWALRHAGVFDAMLKLKAEEKTGLNPLVFATRTNMSAEVLEALLQYLASANLITFKKDGVHFTPEGQALFDHEDGTLGLFRAYQPTLDNVEHLLAKLRTPGAVARKPEYLLESQAQRYADEVFPAIDTLVAAHKFSHLLDLTCGNGELLMHVLQHRKNIVGVAIGSDSAAVRRANNAITSADLDTRLIAVTANPTDACTDTQRTFDRIGISRQLWKDFDCVLATGLLTDLAGKPEEIVRILAAISRHFPSAHLLLVEPVDSPRLQKNYYAPELSLLMQLSRTAPLPTETWRDHFAAAKFKLLQEAPLTTEGLTLFLAKPLPQPATHKPPPSREADPRLA